MPTTWTNQTKSGKTEKGTYLTLSTVDSDILLKNPGGDKIALNASKEPVLTTTWTNQDKI